jgi:Ca2+:H+ antiporter
VVAVITEIIRTPLLWLLLFVPAVLAGEHLWPEAHTWLFVLSVLAIVPLAALLSRATETVADRTGDSVGGLLNATLGNLTELVIALTALRAGELMLVKASIAGAIVTNALFMLGGSFLLGGLKYHEQVFNKDGARFQGGLLLLATVGLLVPSAIAAADRSDAIVFVQQVSLGLAVLLMSGYALGIVFSLGTHRESFASTDHGSSSPEDSSVWPLPVGIVVLGGVTVLVALVSEVFVGSVQKAADALSMTPAFVGFIVVALVGAAAEMTTAFSAARSNRLDLSIAIALGSAVQIALFVAPMLVLASWLIAPVPLGLDFWPGAVVMILFAMLTALFTTNSGRSTWFLGVMCLLVYAIFAMTLFLMPPRG